MSSTSYTRRRRHSDRSTCGASHMTCPRAMSPTLVKMINWPPHDTVTIVYDSDDDVKQHVPQCTGNRGAANISHTPTATAHHLPPCTSAYQSVDRNTEESEPAVPTVGQAEESTQPPARHLAHCQICQNPCDLMQFYEPAEGGGHIFTGCRTCRQRDESTTEGLRQTYKCPCGSILRATSRKGHEQTKKHKAWNRSAHSGVRVSCNLLHEESA
jgi:hypothetical protein